MVRNAPRLASDRARQFHAFAIRVITVTARAGALWKIAPNGRRQASPN